MVRAGEKGFLFEKFIERNIVAVGWNKLGDLSASSSREKIKYIFEEEYEITGVKAGLYAGILNRFIDEFNEDDVLMTYDPINRYYKIGKIKSGYYYEDSDDIEYHHRRNVEWSRRIDRDQLSIKTKHALGSVLTIFEVKNGAKKEIFDLIISGFSAKERQRITRQSKDKIFEKFSGKCAYCETEIGDSQTAKIENFYPIHQYPELALEDENLLLACSYCNFLKAGDFPMSEDGFPLLFNPNTDKRTDHFKVSSDGKITGTTEKGKTTITLLKLNREDLIEERKNRILEKQLDRTIEDINPDYFENFCNNIEIIRQLADMGNMIRPDLQYQQFAMLFSNAITNLETYLSDTLRLSIQKNKDNLRRFVSTFKDFQDIKFSITNIFEEYEQIEERVNKSLQGIMYHNLPKLKGVFRDSLEVEFPDIRNLTKAIIKRHDFVHRNGRTTKGDRQAVSKEDVYELCNEIMIFVKEINQQIKG